MNSRRYPDGGDVPYRCSIGTQAETGVGTIASAHNAAAYKNVVVPSWQTTSSGQTIFWSKGRNLKTDSCSCRKSGLGIEIDPKKLKKYRFERREAGYV